MNLHSRNFKLIELLVLFVLIPASFTLPYSFVLKASIALLGFIYVVFIILKLEDLRFEISKEIKWKKFWKAVMIRFIIIAIITHGYIYILEPDNLYVVIKNKPGFFIIILIIYTLFSVYPQEVIYRTFFFSRYAVFFRDKKIMVFINAVLFSFAHLFFGNIIVSVITFLGGLLFANTFLKTKSTLAVSIEHAIYGCWLFTVGMGNMLGFPS